METAIFTCTICSEPSTEICVYCTKDTCRNHLCARCRKCSDCCECEVPLTEPEPELAPVPALVPETAHIPETEQVIPEVGHDSPVIAPEPSI